MRSTSRSPRFSSTHLVVAASLAVCFLASCRPGSAPSVKVTSERFTIYLVPPIDQTGDQRLARGMKSFRQATQRRIQALSASVKKVMIITPANEAATGRAAIRLRFAGDLAWPVDHPLFPWQRNNDNSHVALLPNVALVDNRPAKPDGNNITIAVTLGLEHPRGSAASRSPWPVAASDQDSATQLKVHVAAKFRPDLQCTASFPAKEILPKGTDGVVLAKVVEHTASCILAGALRRDSISAEAKRSHALLRASNSTSYIARIIRGVDDYAAFIRQRDAAPKKAVKALGGALRSFRAALTDQGPKGSALAHYLLVHAATTTLGQSDLGQDVPATLRAEARLALGVHASHTFTANPYNSLAASWTRALAHEAAGETSDAQKIWRKVLERIENKKGPHLFFTRHAELKAENRIAGIERRDEQYAAALKRHIALRDKILEMSTKDRASVSEPRAGIEMELAIDYDRLARLAHKRFREARDTPALREFMRHKLDALRDASAAKRNLVGSLKKDSLLALCSARKPKGCVYLRNMLIGATWDTYNTYHIQSLHHLNKAWQELRRQRIAACKRLGTNGPATEGCADMSAEELKKSEVPAASSKMADSVAVRRANEARRWEMVVASALVMRSCKNREQWKKYNKRIGKYLTRGVRLPSFVKTFANCSLLGLARHAESPRKGTPWPLGGWVSSPPDPAKVAGAVEALRQHGLSDSRESRPALLLMEYASLWQAMARYSQWRKNHTSHERNVSLNKLAESLKQQFRPAVGLDGEPTVTVVPAKAASDVVPKVWGLYFSDAKPQFSQVLGALDGAMRAAGKRSPAGRNMWKGKRTLRTRFKKAEEDWSRRYNAARVKGTSNPGRAFSAARGHADEAFTALSKDASRLLSLLTASYLKRAAAHLSRNERGSALDREVTAAIRMSFFRVLFRAHSRSEVFSVVQKIHGPQKLTTMIDEVFSSLIGAESDDDLKRLTRIGNWTEAFYRLRWQGVSFFRRDPNDSSQWLEVDSVEEAESALDAGLDSYPCSGGEREGPPSDSRREAWINRFLGYVGVHLERYQFQKILDDDLRFDKGYRPGLGSVSRSYRRDFRSNTADLARRHQWDFANNYRNWCRRVRSVDRETATLGWLMDDDQYLFKVWSPPVLSTPDLPSYVRGARIYFAAMQSHYNNPTRLVRELRKAHGFLSGSRLPDSSLTAEVRLLRVRISIPWGKVMGDLKNAGKYGHQPLNLVEADLSNRTPRIILDATFNENMGDAKMLMGRKKAYLKAAVDYYQKALKEDVHRSGTSDSGGATQKARLWVKLAAVKIEQKKYDQALAATRRAARHPSARLLTIIAAWGRGERRRAAGLLGAYKRDVSFLDVERLPQPVYVGTNYKWIAKKLMGGRR